jgi:hypothetical protein
LRSLLWAQRRAARRPFHIVQNEDIGEYSKEDRALDAAGFMVQRFVLGVVSGASGMSFPGFAPASSDNIAVAGVQSAHEKTPLKSVWLLTPAPPLLPP